MSSARNKALEPQSTGDTQYNVRNAALHGASLAFSKPPIKPKPQVNNYTGGDNGALLAARNSTAGSPASLQRETTGGSPRSLSRPALSPMQASSKSNSSSNLGVPDDHLDRVPSPSNIAARLAAARHSPLRPLPQSRTMSEQDVNERDVLPPSGSVGNVLARLQPQQSTPQPPKRRDSWNSHPAASSVERKVSDVSDSKPTDESSIPPTTSLVKMFEQNRPTTPTKARSGTVVTTKGGPPPLKSPLPQRRIRLPSVPSEEVLQFRVEGPTPTPGEPKPRHHIEIPAQTVPTANGPRQEPLRSPPIKQKPAKLAAINTSVTPPRVPTQKRPAKTTTSAQETPRPRSKSTPKNTPRRLSNSIDSLTLSSPSSFKSAKEEQDGVEEKPKPIIPPPRRSNTRKEPPQDKYLSPRNQSQPPSTMQGVTPPPRPASATGSSVYHKNYQRQSIEQISKHMTGESLSSAIMGAALAASSRNASPAPRSMSTEPLFAARKHHHHHLPHSPWRRTPSPQKSSPPKTSSKLRTTMRKEPSSSEDEDHGEKYKKKGTRIMGIKARKHPNKHHEGTRKRWRDRITERERKRYEGVWAANKGHFLPANTKIAGYVSDEEDTSQDVLNLCVQEIWMRSRLSDDVLEEVWDLVDGRGIGRLNRWEFVVGLWLIDQRLKGRKLPIRVSESVWVSARGVGIKVKVHK